MDNYLGWLTSGLIFLWILAAQDARAAPAEPGAAGCAPSQFRVALSADGSSNGRIRAVNGCALRGRRNAASPHAGDESRH